MKLTFIFSKNQQRRRIDAVRCVAPQQRGRWFVFVQHLSAAVSQVGEAGQMGSACNDTHERSSQVWSRHRKQLPNLRFSFCFVF